MATPNYTVNYDDKRLTQVNNNKEAALSDVEETYGGMISNSDKYYQKQIDASKEWANTQTKLQNEKTDFAIQEINQQKAQAKQDYTKEQSGAYVDWQKQSNEYGANAEQMAAQGMANTGFAESSQVSMYNTYQNRVATARQSYDRAVLNYNNAITEARLQNNSVLAEIAYESLQEQLELSLAGFQYKNTLIIEQANRKREVEQDYHNRWQDVLKQINTENALAEEVRQYNETLAESKRHNAAVEAAQAAQLAEEKRQFNILHSQTTTTPTVKKSSVARNIVRSSGFASKDTVRSKIQSAAKGDTKLKNTSNNTKSSKPPVDGKSVLALGYGPISDKTIAELVDEGKAIPYLKDGKVHFKKAFGG